MSSKNFIMNNDVSEINTNLNSNSSCKFKANVHVSLDHNDTTASFTAINYLIILEKIFNQKPYIKKLFFSNVNTDKKNPKLKLHFNLEVSLSYEVIEHLVVLADTTNFLYDKDVINYNLKLLQNKNSSVVSFRLSNPHISYNFFSDHEDNAFNSIKKPDITEFLISLTFQKKDIAHKNYLVKLFDTKIEEGLKTFK